MKKKTKQPKSVKVIVKNCPSLTSLKITPERVVPIAEWRVGDLMLMKMSLSKLSIEADKLSANLGFYSNKISEIIDEINSRRLPKNWK